MVRAEQVQATRDLIMTAAERLFAEHGVAAVSARQISEAAGQGNTAAVGYHFGTKTGLVRAIIRRHTSDIERIRARMTDEAARTSSQARAIPPARASADARAGPDCLRDWVACLVRPTTDHLAGLGAPTWFARFGAQVLTDPQLRPLLMEEAGVTPAMPRILRGVNRSLAGLPARVRSERDDMALALIVHVVAEHERALAGQPGQSGESGDRAQAAQARPAGDGWHDTAAGLIDAIVGLYTAPVTTATVTTATVTTAPVATATVPVKTPEEGKQ